MPPELDIEESSRADEALEIYREMTKLGLSVGITEKDGGINIEVSGEDQENINLISSLVLVRNYFTFLIQKTPLLTMPFYYTLAALCCTGAYLFYAYGFMLYADCGVSGVTLDRPALRALKEDIATGRVAQIVVADISRIARDPVEVMQFGESAELYGAEIINLNDGGQAASFEDDSRNTNDPVIAMYSSFMDGLGSY
jgi:hypothetical protein